MSLVFLLAAGAAEIRVPLDAPTLSDAVDASFADDVVLVDGGLVGSWVSPSPIRIGHALTIRGVGAARPSLGGGDPEGSLFVVDGADATLTLEDLVLDGDELNRAVHVVRGGLTLRRVATVAHATDGDGGTLLVGPAGGQVLIEDSQLSQGVTGGVGGLVAVFGGTLTLRRARLSTGVAANTGGLLHLTAAALVIEDSTLELGSAGGRGGAVHLINGEPAHIERTRLIGSIANGGFGGGAIYAEGVGLTVADTWFQQNTAHGNEGGGAIYLRNGPHTLDRVVFCDNDASAGAGGAIRLHDHVMLTLTNGVFVGNGASSAGGALYLRQNASASLVHASIVTSRSGADGQAAWSTGALSLTHAYVADHPDHVALFGDHTNDLSVEWSAFHRNTTGDTIPAMVGMITDDSFVPTPIEPCEPLELLLPLDSPLVGGGLNGADIGAFGGDGAWTDLDGDGVLSLYDCDDTRSDVHPGAVELPADGVDSDCDGVELCWDDADQDGRGDPDKTVESLDLDCRGPGEADNPDDVCPGWPDDEDLDGDGVPDGCDPCPLDFPDDTDGDGVCDSDDQCPGHDDRIDTDGDGVPNGCDVCEDGDPDADGDGVPDDCDICPGHDDTQDADGDGIPDGCDPCPFTPDPTCAVGPRPPAAAEGRTPAHVGCGCAAGASGGWGIGVLALGLSAGRRRPRRR